MSDAQAAQEARAGCEAGQDTGERQQPPGFSRYLKRARRIIGQADEVIALLARVPDKLRKNPRIHYLAERIGVMVRMLRAATNREYTLVPYPALLAILAALIYFVFTFDVIADLLPIVGFLDDAGVLAYVLARFSDEMQKYEAWEQEQEDAGRHASDAQSSVTDS